MIRRNHAARDEGRGDRYLGQAPQYPHIEEEGANRADVCRAEAYVQGRARPRYDGATREDADAHAQQAGASIGSRWR